jgi:hypothetical protein
VLGELPEQVPYQEWLHSDYRESASCQSCHMPVVEQDVPITAVLGEPRTGFSRHTFVGANFFMLRLLQGNRLDLGIQALPQELEAAARQRESDEWCRKENPTPRARYGASTERQAP